MGLPWALGAPRPAGPAHPWPLGFGQLIAPHGLFADVEHRARSNGVRLIGYVKSPQSPRWPLAAGCWPLAAGCWPLASVADAAAAAAVSAAVAAGVVAAVGAPPTAAPFFPAFNRAKGVAAAAAAPPEAELAELQERIREADRNRTGSGASAGRRSASCLRRAKHDPCVSNASQPPSLQGV